MSLENWEVKNILAAERPIKSREESKALVKQDQTGLVDRIQALMLKEQKYLNRIRQLETALREKETKCSKLEIELRGLRNTKAPLYSGPQER